MAYRLGVDLGTTYTAAALNLDGRVEMLSLGNRATQIASVVYVKEDGTVLIGEPAEYRGAADPTRLAREFKRRIGGVVPIIVGGSPYSPQSLLARVLGRAVEVATRQQGEAPEHVCVTYPANWGPFKHEILEQVIKLAGLRGASTCTEPEAAAIAYASRDRVPQGAKLAVYDLGGGTFDAAVLVRDGVGFRLVGNPDGVEHLGGIDFDAAVLQHVLDQLGPAVQQLDDSDPATLLGLNRLRRDCVTAKETLSSDDEAVIPVALPGLSTFVPLTRAQFEEMVRPAIGETVSATRRALSSAGVPPEELHAIVMVGGSSRIPLVAQELTTAFGRPLARDNHPKHDVALGAAIRAIEPVHPYVPTAVPVADGRGRSAGGPV
ncbi:MAG TPA: Hsp70 family protein, partial [Pseudonocardia sp.]|nr:Hsp70 family protein [Pseudonocardia sp.]